MELTNVVQVMCELLGRRIPTVTTHSSDVARNAACFFTANENNPNKNVSTDPTLCKKVIFPFQIPCYSNRAVTHYLFQNQPNASSTICKVKFRITHPWEEDFGNLALNILLAELWI